MALVDDNKFPKLIITEGSAPSSPSSGDQKVYIDSTSHHLSRKNSGGTVTDLETTLAHGCRVKRASTNFSVGNNTYTSVAFDAEDFDTDSMHDTVTNNTRITIPTILGVTTGQWSITAHGYITGQTLVDSKFRLNGTTDISFHRENDGGVGTFLNTCTYVLSATDYIECQLRSPSGTASAAFDAGISPLFEVAFLGKVT